MRGDTGGDPREAAVAESSGFGTVKAFGTRISIGNRSMKSAVSTLWISLASGLFLTGAAAAETGPHTDFLACRAVEQAGQRLTCFEEASVAAITARASGQSGDTRGLEPFLRCVAPDGKEDRLRCYDRAAAGSPMARADRGDRADAPSTPAAPARPTSPSRPAQAPAAPSPIATPDRGTASAQDAADIEAETEEFGRRQPPPPPPPLAEETPLQQDTDGVEILERNGDGEAVKIRAAIASYKYDGYDRIIVTLVNGQVWKQERGSKIRPSAAKDVHHAVIKRGMMNSYRMRIDDRGPWVHAERRDQ